METVSALVADLDVTDTAAALQGAPALPPAAGKQAEPIKPNASKAIKAAIAQQPAAAGKGTKQTAVYSRQGKQPAAPADDAVKVKPVADKQAVDAVARGKAADTEAATATARVSEGPSPSNSRPSRQRTKAQPYWIGGAAGSPSYPIEGRQTVPAASDAVLASGVRESAAAEPTHADVARSNKAAAKDKAAAVTKRQNRSSPQKEQQQPAKKCRAGNKQQEEQLPAEANAEAEQEAGAEVKIARVGKQASKAKEGHVTRQTQRDFRQVDDERVQTGNNDQVPESAGDEAMLDEAVGESGRNAEVTLTEQPGETDAVRAAAEPATAAKDPIAGALQRFGLKHPTRPVGVSKIDLASSFTDAFSPAHPLSGATAKPAALGKQVMNMMMSFMFYHVSALLFTPSRGWYGSCHSLGSCAVMMHTLFSH